MYDYNNQYDIEMGHGPQITYTEQPIPQRRRQTSRNKSSNTVIKIINVILCVVIVAVTIIGGIFLIHHIVKQSKQSKPSSSSSENKSPPKPMPDLLPKTPKSESQSTSSDDPKPQAQQSNAAAKEWKQLTFDQIKDDENGDLVFQSGNHYVQISAQSGSTESILWKSQDNETIDEIWTCKPVDGCEAKMVDSTISRRLLSGNWKIIITGNLKYIRNSSSIIPDLKKLMQTETSPPVPPTDSAQQKPKAPAPDVPSPKVTPEKTPEVSPSPVAPEKTASSPPSPSKPEASTRQAPPRAASAVITTPTTVPSSKDWNCAACTYLNHITKQKCEMCGTEKPTPNPQPNASWACSKCTYLNPAASKECEICNTEKQESTQSLDEFLKAVDKHQTKSKWSFMSLEFTEEQKQIAKKALPSLPINKTQFTLTKDEGSIGFTSTSDGPTIRIFGSQISKVVMKYTVPGVGIFNLNPAKASLKKNE